MWWWPSDDWNADKAALHLPTHDRPCVRPKCSPDSRRAASTSFSPEAEIRRSTPMRSLITQLPGDNLPFTKKQRHCRLLMHLRGSPWGRSHYARRILLNRMQAAFRVIRGSRLAIRDRLAARRRAMMMPVLRIVEGRAHGRQGHSALLNGSLRHDT